MSELSAVYDGAPDKPEMVAEFTGATALDYSFSGGDGESGGEMSAVLDDGGDGGGDSFFGGDMSATLDSPSVSADSGAAKSLFAELAADFE